MIDGRFRPTRWLPGPHLQTIVASLASGPPVGGDTENLVVRVSPGSQIRLDVNRPRGSARGTLVLVHGMCGCSESAYMRRTARQALDAGWICVRMNLRNCGGTETLADTLYNAGQSEDVHRALEALDLRGFTRPLCLAGFSLGGNLVLLHAGRAGPDCLADAVGAVNPPIRLELCAREIDSPRNAIYRAYYLVRLCAQLRRVARVRPLPRRPQAPHRIRTLRRFDDLYTAPDAGYGSAEEYYERASAAPSLGSVRRPTLLLSAADDPFVPRAMFSPHHANARIRFVHPPRGGHCGYWQQGRPRYWAGQLLLRFFESSRGRTGS